MLRIIVATAQPEGLRFFIETLSSDSEVRLDEVRSGTEALSLVSTSSAHLVVIDRELPDIKPLELVRKLLTHNAMVSTAVVSSLSEEEFHEASEGLGILARLPVQPGKDDAAELMNKLRSVLGQLG